jgi:hypothetical protein
MLAASTWYIYFANYSAKNSGSRHSKCNWDYLYCIVQGGFGILAKAILLYKTFAEDKC